MNMSTIKLGPTHAASLAALARQPLFAGKETNEERGMIHMVDARHLIAIGLAEVSEEGGRAKIQLTEAGRRYRTLTLS
jgi:hypothetical protein